MMDATLGYILCSQSPTLFLAAVVLLLCYFARRRSHHARAVLDLVLCIVCAAAGVALYFFGMGRGYFTIRDFYVIRTPAWIGMGGCAGISGRQPPPGRREGGQPGRQCRGPSARKGRKGRCKTAG